MIKVNKPLTKKTKDILLFIKTKTKTKTPNKAPSPKKVVYLKKTSKKTALNLLSSTCNTFLLYKETKINDPKKKSHTEVLLVFLKQTKKTQNEILNYLTK